MVPRSALLARRKVAGDTVGWPKYCIVPVVELSHGSVVDHLGRPCLCSFSPQPACVSRQHHEHVRHLPADLGAQPGHRRLGHEPRHDHGEHVLRISRYDFRRAGVTELFRWPSVFFTKLLADTVFPANPLRLSSAFSGLGTAELAGEAFSAMARSTGLSGPFTPGQACDLSRASQAVLCKNPLITAVAPDLLDFWEADFRTGLLAGRRSFDDL